MLQDVRDRLARGVTTVDAVVDRLALRALRGRPGWHTAVLPYVGHGTSTCAHLRARVLLRRAPEADGRSYRRDGLRGVLADLRRGIAPYLSVEVASEAVLVEVAGRELQAVSGADGYVGADVDLPGTQPGWHPVRWRLASDPGRMAEGRLLVVDPAARLAVVSDIDDTVVHTGLTQVIEALRTSLLTPEHERRAVLGASDLYRGLVAGDGGRAPVFYVSTGAWNLHGVMERFLERHEFPAGPLLMTDWGPGRDWLFRESSLVFKSRSILGLIADHPHLSWVLVGDSGQHDPEAYALVVREQADRVRAVFVREVPPHPPGRAQRVREIAAELANSGVPMLLVRDNVEAAEHAADLGLIDAETVARVRSAFGGR